MTDQLLNDESKLIHFTNDFKDVKQNSDILDLVPVNSDASLLPLITKQESERFKFTNER